MISGPAPVPPRLRSPSSAPAPLPRVLVHPTLQRVLLSLLPAALILGLAGVAIWGESGLLVRDRLQQEFEASIDERAALDRENQELLRQLRQMREDDAVLERVVADELGLVPEGAVLIRFR